MRENQSECYTFDGALEGLKLARHIPKRTQDANVMRSDRAFFMKLRVEDSAMALAPFWRGRILQSRSPARMQWTVGAPRPDSLVRVTLAVGVA